MTLSEMMATFVDAAISLEERIAENDVRNADRLRALLHAIHRRLVADGSEGTNALTRLQQHRHPAVRSAAVQVPVPPPPLDGLARPRA